MAVHHTAFAWVAPVNSPNERHVLLARGEHATFFDDQDAVMFNGDDDHFQKLAKICGNSATEARTAFADLEPDATTSDGSAPWSWWGTVDGAHSHC